MTVEIEPIGNQVELLSLGNSVEVSIFDVYTDRAFLSQFQINEENKEVRHADNA